MNPDFTRYQTLPRLETQIPTLSHYGVATGQPLESAARFGSSEFPFPLALALSRWERENLSPTGPQANALPSSLARSAGLTEVGDMTNPHPVFGKCCLLYPLPQDEWHGEGKTAARQAQGAQPIKSS